MHTGLKLALRVLNKKHFKLPDVLHDNVCMIDENRPRVLEVERTGTPPLVRKLETVKAVKKMDKHFSKENVYYPFRMTNSSDNERCRILSFFVSMRDEGRYQAADRSGTFGASKLSRIAKDFLSGEVGELFYSLASILPMLQQKWWYLFGKYWLVKNGHNNDDVKLMKWLMTGGNHCMIDTSGKNVSQDVSLCKGVGRLMQSQCIDNPSKKLKLELGLQLPIKSPFKMKRDIIKMASSNHLPWVKEESDLFWYNRKVVQEYADCGPLEMTLPNSRIAIFDECVTQKFHNENPRSILFVIDEPPIEDK